MYTLYFKREDAMTVGKLSPTHEVEWFSCYRMLAELIRQKYPEFKADPGGTFRVHIADIVVEMGWETPTDRHGAGI